MADDDSASSRQPALLVLGIALALLVLSLAAAVTPRGLVHGPLNAAIQERRDVAVLAGIGTALAMGVGLAITLLGS